MAERNGRRRIRAVSEIVHIPMALPNRQKRNGSDLETVDVDVVFYRKDGAPPLSVLMAMDDAAAEYDEDKPTAEERGDPGDPTVDPPIPPTPGTLSIRRWIAKSNRAESLLRQRLLVAATDGELRPEDAGVIVSRGEAESILAVAGWWSSTPDAQSDDDEGEAVGESEVVTGQPDSPDSAPVTPVTTPSR